MRRILTCIILAAAGPVMLLAQTSVKALYSKENLSWQSPWLEGVNMAAHTLNSFFLTDTVSALSTAALRADMATGEMKSIFAPETDLTGTAGIRSYMRIHRTYLYGDFSYSYGYGRNSRWRGLIDPYRTPFMMADSIPGNISRETYAMTAGAAYATGRHTSLGIRASYEASLMSKHKDLRNKNTYMNFEILPGVLFHTRNLRLGLDAGYRRTTEEVEYMQVDESTEKYLFELYGLWLYRSLGYNSADHSRMLINSAFHGDLTLELLFGNFRLFNNFTTEYDYGTQDEIGYNHLKYGDTRTLTYSDRLILSWGPSHKIQADVTFSRILGYKFLQRQEYDPDSGVRIWITYGSPINSYSGDYSHMDLNYTYRHATDFLHADWEITAGASHLAYDRTVKEHPIYLSQEIRAITPYLQGAWHWRSPRHQLDIRPGIAYTRTYRGIPDEITNESGMDISTGDTPLQLEGPLMEEYRFLAADRLCAGASLRYGWCASPAKGSVLSIELYYGLETALSSGENRHHTSLSIGFTF